MAMAHGSKYQTSWPEILALAQAEKSGLSAEKRLVTTDTKSIEKRGLTIVQTGLEVRVVGQQSKSL